MKRNSAVARAVFPVAEPVEPRIHLFGTRFNFQPASAWQPPHWRADVGDAYRLHRNGLTFGWSRANYVNATDRNSPLSPRQQYDTFNRLAGDIKWEIAVPNGTYFVRIVAGDPNATVGNYKIAAENVWIVQGVTNRKTRWLTGSGIVTVSDGRLTLSRLGDSTAINSIEIFPRGNMNAHYFDGVTVTGDYKPSAVIPQIRKLGARGVRMWSNIIDWNERTIRTAYNYIQQYHAAGFLTTLLIQTKVVPTSKQAKAFFDWVQTVPGLLKGVDRWEIGNEPDISKYYNGTLPQYVNQELKPAYESLHRNGEIVVGAGLTAALSQSRWLVRNGYLQYVDYANIHPYRYSAAQQRDFVRQISEVFAGRPITATEYNMQFPLPDMNAWAQNLNDAHPTVKHHFESAFYFKLVAGDNSPAAPAGLLNPHSLTAHQPFYNMYRAWHPTKSSSSSATSTARSAIATVAGRNSSTSTAKRRDDALDVLDGLFSNTQVI